MKEKMTLQRSFLKNPINSIGILLAIALLFEGFSWAGAYNNKMAYLQHVGGIGSYVGRIFRGMILPEICTLYILISLIEWYHKAAHIDSIKLTWPSISRYELRILPVLLGAFFIFNPFTQTIRYLINAYPHYEFGEYWTSFIVGTFTIRMYVTYLVPMILIGYAAVNGSLIADYIAYQDNARKEAERLRLLASSTKSKVSPKSDYLTTVKGRNPQGEMIFPVEECFYFEVEERSYYVVHAKGRYVISKTLNELEAELDPSQFFRANRGVVLNRRTVQSYAYWERGKYIVRLSAPCQQVEIALPRARLQEFRDWLGGEPVTGSQGSQSPMLTGSF